MLSAQKYGENLHVNYSPFGAILYGRNWSSEYRYGFNSQEKDDEVSGEGNSYTAEFWQYSPRLAMRWNLDPKPNPAISPYAAFAGNPILYRDPFGDTIKLTDKFKNCQSCMEAYKLWSESKAGQKYIKLYGEGGKYSKVNVWIGNDLETGERGTTNAIAIDKEGSRRKIEWTYNYKTKEWNNGGPLKDGERLELEVNIDISDWHRKKAGTPVPYGDFSVPKGQERYTKEDAEKHNNSLYYRGGMTLLHEMQHVQMITEDFIKSKQMVRHPFYQHREMKAKSGDWYKERYEYWKQYDGEGEPNLNYFAD